MFSLPPDCTGAGLTNCSPTIGQLGTAGRNILVGPAERDWDFSLVKDTKLGFLGEAGMLEFRAEFFNVLNHPNFSGQHFSTQIFNGSPGDHLPPEIGPFSEQPSNGRVNQQVQDGQREIQFALRSNSKVCGIAGAFAAGTRRGLLSRCARPAKILNPRVPHPLVFKGADFQVNPISTIKPEMAMRRESPPA